MEKANKRLDLILLIFSIIWVVIVGLDYINKHPLYEFSYLYFRFYRLTLFFLGFSSLVAFFSKKSTAFRKYYFTGVGLAVTLIIFLSSLAISFSAYVADVDFGLGHLVNFLWGNIKSLLFLAALSLSAYCYGDILKIRFIKHPIYKIALGLIVIVNLILFVASIKYYNFYSALCILILPVVINFRQLPQLFYAITFRPVKEIPSGYLGIISLLGVMFFLCINFAHTHSPFPVGFDSRNFYMNVARQVSLKEGLIFGHRPYNWSLIISLGYSIFKSSAIAVSISFYGFILSCFAIYQLGKKALGIKNDYVLFVLLLITITPAISNQLYIELKTDMGLLFYQTISILYLIKLFKSKGFNKFLKMDSVVKFRMKGNLLKVCLLGLFLGFGLSIKMTNMFLVFAIVVCIYWLFSESNKVILSVVSLTSLVFIIAGLDNLTGLNEYHLGMTTLKVVLVLIFLITLILVLLRGRKVQALNATIVAIWLGVFSIVPLSPWIIKNYSDTKSLNPAVLLNGAFVGPDINLNTIDQNYRKSLREN